jgi:metal-responsive CopG/Arc/MetJ family transcriptional regulator
MQKLNPDAETIRTSISLDEGMVERIMEMVEWLDITKSDFIRKAISSELKKDERKKNK